jgi:hypothetical protein
MHFHNIYIIINIIFQTAIAISSGNSISIATNSLNLMTLLNLLSSLL